MKKTRRQNSHPSKTQKIQQENRSQKIQLIGSWLPLQHFQWCSKNIGVAKCSQLPEHVLVSKLLYIQQTQGTHFLELPRELYYNCSSVSISV